MSLNNYSTKSTFVIGGRLVDMDRADDPDLLDIETAAGTLIGVSKQPSRIYEDSDGNVVVDNCTCMRVHQTPGCTKTIVFNYPNSK